MSLKLRRELNKARKVETAVSEKARLLNRAARQFIRRECGTFRGPKRFAKPVDFGRLFKKHGVKTAPGPGLQPLSEAELEKVVGGAKDPNWRPGGTPKAEPKPVVKEQMKVGLESQKYIDKLIKDLQDITISKNGTKNFRSQGGFEQVLKDFDSLPLLQVKSIKTKYGNGKLGYLEHDIKVVARPGSKEGSATLEITITSHKKIKIRY